MQIQAENYELFANLINHARSILILAEKKPGVDTLAAALFLEDTLTSRGRKVQIVSRNEIPKEFRHLSERIKNKIEPKKVVVSFNWHRNEIEKVGYNLDGEKFNFIVSPRNGSIKRDEINISYKGAEADLVITLGISSLSSLSSHEREHLLNKEIINIDNSAKNQLFGKLNFVSEDADSVCGVIGKLIEKNQLDSTPEAADYLLVGLKSTTENFNSVADPTTFEVAAFCARIKKGVISRQINQKDTKNTKETLVPKDWLSPKVFRSKQAS
jgi:nanoRNase/pAp phosphatase (c-di-AMP/oligoRNAs hydrolase)